MLSELESLATDVAILSAACSRMTGGELVVMRQIVAHLERVLGTLSETPGMLAGDMAWWTAWKQAACRGSGPQPPSTTT